jgi:predicted nuclease of predicted toxin-antitoxin system
MPLSFLLDEHLPKALAIGLRLRGIEVSMAYAEGVDGFSDVELLHYATNHNMVLISQDDDLLVIAADLQTQGIAFSGVIYSHQRQLSVGELVRDLELVANTLEPEEIQNTVLYLPI